MKKIGIIAGAGALPAELAKACMEDGTQVYIVLLKSENTEDELTVFDHKCFSIGSVGGILDYFHACGVKDLVMAGKIGRPDLSSLKVDFTGGILLTKLLTQKLRGDDHLLKILAKFLEDKGFNVLSANELLKRHSGVEVATKASPSGLDLTDIELGKKVLHALGNLDVGQSVIVSGGYVLGIEAAEGTDNLIKRCAALRRAERGGVLVKMMKCGQDTRLDIPAIGPETIECLGTLHYSGIAIEKNGVIIIEKARVQHLADQYGLFIKY